MAKQRVGFVPTLDRILVQRIEVKNESKGGIILPDSSKEKPREGIVVAVGSGRITKEGDQIPIALANGDHVVFGPFAGSEVQLDSGDYLLLNEDDVFGIIR